MYLVSGAVVYTVELQRLLHLLFVPFSNVLLLFLFKGLERLMMMMMIPVFLHVSWIVSSKEVIEDIPVEKYWMDFYLVPAKLSLWAPTLTAVFRV